MDCGNGDSVENDNPQYNTNGINSSGIIPFFSAWGFGLGSSRADVGGYDRCYGLSVRGVVGEIIEEVTPIVQ